MGKESNQQVVKLEDGVHIVQGGKIIEILLPKDYGQDIINWQHGKVFEVNETKKRRIRNI